MKFSELMNLKSDDAGNIDINDLSSCLPNTPHCVLEQFYRDHGRKELFQLQYSDLDISNLHWLKEELSFTNILNITVYPRFQQWVDNCEAKARRVAIENDWKLIGHTESTISHWKLNKTWCRAPILLDQGSTIQLVEGHSRYGCLKGLVATNLVPTNKKHKIWVGKYI